MFEYWDIDKFVIRKADLYNYINPFFNLKYMKSHNFFYTLMALDKYKNYFANIYNDVDYNIHLDIHQKKAILVSPKNELILAGAGSGKTTTIAAKIKFMVEVLKMDPDEILLLSYTNEAVREMQQIIVDKFKIKVSIMTFHKFAIGLLGNSLSIKECVNYHDIKYSKIEKFFLLSYLYLFSNMTIQDIINEKFARAFLDFEQDFNKYYYEKLPLKGNIKSLLFRVNARIFESKVNDAYRTFDSLIWDASKLDIYNIHYKYILIDEYQDISNLRLSFIKKYVAKENSKLMCVGDDWQTIFSFASSNINNILDFEKTFCDTKVLKIINTYRNSQELIDIAGQFIMKNSRQIKKNLKSIKRMMNPIEIIEYSGKNDLISKISANVEKFIDKKIAFISRYKNDIDIIVDDVTFKRNGDKIIYKDQKEIYFYTIHSSKGLGFDYVFILNNQSGYYGFPPKRNKTSIFKAEKSILEERRLFYVGLTRTKNKVYLITPANKNSLFLKEIKKMLKKN